MTIAETRKLAKYFGMMYKATGSQSDREALGYLRGILLKHNLKSRSGECGG